MDGVTCAPRGTRSKKDAPWKRSWHRRGSSTQLHEPGVVSWGRTTTKHPLLGRTVPIHRSANTNTFHLTTLLTHKTHHTRRLRRLFLRSTSCRIAPPWSSIVQLHPFLAVAPTVSLPPSSHPRGRYTPMRGCRGFLCFSEVSEGRGWRDHQIHPLCEQTHPRVGHVATRCATCDASSFDFRVERDVLKADLVSRKKSVRKNSDSIDPRTRECEPTGDDGVFFCCSGCGWWRMRSKDCKCKEQESFKKKKWT